MPLGKHQLQMARVQAEKARGGDPKAIAFWQEMEGRTDQIAIEFKLVRDGKDAGGKAKRILLDCKISHLSQNQVEKAVVAALSIEGGNDNARRFYATQKEAADQGSSVAAEFVMVMDEAIGKQEKGIDVYAKPDAPFQTPGAKAAAAAQKAMGVKVEAPPQNAVASKTVVGGDVLRERARLLREAAKKADLEALEADKVQAEYEAKDAEVAKPPPPADTKPAPEERPTV